MKCQTTSSVTVLIGSSSAFSLHIYCSKVMDHDIVHDIVHDEDLDKVTTASCMKESRMQAALLRENPRVFRNSFLKLYGCIFVGYLCSATNGFDSNTFGTLNRFSEHELALCLIKNRWPFRHPSVHQVFRHQHPEPRFGRGALRDRKYSRQLCCWSLLGHIWSPCWHGHGIGHLRDWRHPTDRWHKSLYADGRSLHFGHGRCACPDCWPQLCC